MTAGELIREIRRFLSQVDPDNSRWGNDVLLTWLNEAQETVIVMTGCLTDVVEMNSVVNQEEYQLPANAITINWIEYDDKRLSPTDIRSLQINFPLWRSFESGVPRSYYWVRELGGRRYFGLWPKPKEVKTIRLSIVKRPLVLTDETSVPEILEVYHRALSPYVCWRGMIEMGKKDEGESFLKEFEWRVRQIEAGVKIKDNEQIDFLLMRG